MSQPISVKLYQPHPNQAIIHNSINNEPYKYYVLNIGRQFGKSLLGVNQMLYWGLNNPGVKIGWVSPIYRQAKKVYDDLVGAFAHQPGFFLKKDGTALEVHLPNGSSIQFFSAERYDNLRGFTFHYLICDEFAFQAEKAWTEVLRATVLVHGRKVLLISTPKGRNHFYNLYQLDGANSQYKSFTMTSYDNPIIDPKEIDDARLTLPDMIFRQEYLAEFLEDGAGVFKKFTEITDAPLTNRMYAGIDVGRADDYTVLTILNENGDYYYVDRWRHDSWANITDRIAAKINEINPSTLIEVNSVGDAVYEQLRDKLNSPDILEPFVTTSKSKQDIIEGLQVANQNNTIKLMPVDWLKKEYEMFTYEWSHKTRVIKYGAPVGHHDDGVISGALANHSLKVNRIAGNYSFGFA